MAHYTLKTSMTKEIVDSGPKKLFKAKVPKEKNASSRFANKLLSVRVLCY